jgi:hypothetical protein
MHNALTHAPTTTAAHTKHAAFEFDDSSTLSVVNRRLTVPQFNVSHPSDNIWVVATSCLIIQIDAMSGTRPITATFLRMAGAAVWTPESITTVSARKSSSSSSSNIIIIIIIIIINININNINSTVGACSEHFTRHGKSTDKFMFLPTRRLLSTPSPSHVLLFPETLACHLATCLVASHIPTSCSPCTSCMFTCSLFFPWLTHAIHHSQGQPKRNLQTRVPRLLLNTDSVLHLPLRDQLRFT